jgi:hypothetical protein
VVKPEDLAAINTPEVDKLPTYISVGKFQWKPPLPGPKGDKGDPGEPGVLTRPITPAVTTDEIANDAVTEEKLAPDSVTRDEITDGAVTKPKLLYKSVEVTVPAGAISGTYGPDTDLVGGEILGYYPTAVVLPIRVYSIGLTPAGLVTITIDAATAGANTFNVVVLRA